MEVLQPHWSVVPCKNQDKNYTHSVLLDVGFHPESKYLHNFTSLENIVNLIIASMNITTGARGSVVG
jgi:hypothetical protein